MAKNGATSVNRKEEIISAAIEVFSEIGYFRATTAQVAERAQISQPYVFRFLRARKPCFWPRLKFHGPGSSALFGKSSKRRLRNSWKAG